MTFTYGPGVADALAANEDEARSDERYVILDEGNKVSVTMGSKAQYWYYESENAVKRLPFS